MPSRSPLRRLEDILENIARIEQFTAGLDFDRFSTDALAVHASLHALLIVSEAASRLGAEAETLVPGQPWSDIRGLGNVLRHEYDGVDPRIVWRIISSGDLAALKDAVESGTARLRER